MNGSDVWIRQEGGRMRESGQGYVHIIGFIQPVPRSSIHYLPHFLTDKLHLSQLSVGKSSSAFLL